MEMLGSHELAHIFAQLTDPADMARARAVCSLWRNIMNPPHINGVPISDVLRLAPNKLLETACRAGSFVLAKYALSRGSVRLNWKLNGLCEGGYNEIVEHMISHSATCINSGFLKACDNGCAEFAELMISYGATGFAGFAGVLYSACEGGHKEIVELMIKHGATNFDMGLWSACCCGHKEIVELMINSGATTINSGLCYACCGIRRKEYSFLEKKKQKEIVELMISRGATNFDAGLHLACQGGHKEIAELLGNLTPTAVCARCGKLGAEHV